MNPSVAPRIVSLLVGALALGPVPWAQVQFGGIPITHPHPGSYLSGNAEKAVIGQFTEDATADVVLLQGGKLVLLYAPARSESFLRTTESYRDIAVMPDCGPNDRDALLALDSSGLTFLQWNGAALEATDLIGEDWATATLLQVLPSSEKKGLVAAATASGNIAVVTYSSEQFTEQPTVEIGLPIRALAVVDLLGDEELEFAVDDGDGLRIYSKSGTLLHNSLPADCLYPRLLRMREPGATHDSLVWVTKMDSNENQLLSVLRLNTSGLYYESFLQLGLHGEHFALADYHANDDQHLDLLGVSRGDAALRVLKNKKGDPNPPAFTFFYPMEGETFWFDAADVYGTNWISPPAFAAGDLDGDGDADLVAAGHATTSPSTGRVEIFLSDGYDEDLMRANNPKCLRYSEPSSTQATLSFDLEAPEFVDKATHIRGAVWVQPDDSSPVSNNSWTPFTVALPVPGAWTTVVTTGPVSDSPNRPDIFRVQFWPAKMDNEVEVWAGPATTIWARRFLLNINRGCDLDPETIGGYNEPPNIQPGGEGVRTP